MDQLNNLLSWGWTVTCDLYLFHFIVLSNPVFHCSRSFISFSFDKVTTGTYNFVPVISNIVSAGGTIAGLLPCAFLLVISAKAQFLDQVKVNSTSQWISGIFKLLQKLLRCFSGVSFLPTLFHDIPLHHHQHYKYFPVSLFYI